MSSLSAKPIGSAMPSGEHLLTEAQAGLWYVQQIDPSNPILNASQYVELAGELDIDLFRRAFAQMVEEADCLSLTFHSGAFGPSQRLDAITRPSLEIVDLRSEADPASAALALMQADTARPVNLGQGPVARFTLFRLSEDRHYWYERIHHLAIDGYGIVLVTNRVGEIYSGLKSGTGRGTPFAPFAQAMDDGAVYLSDDRRRRDAEFWRHELANLPEVVSLAGGRAVSEHSFRRETRFLSKDLFGVLVARAEHAKVTWPDLLTALVASYCRRFASAAEIVAGVPHMGRLGSKAARVPCTLMNVLPVRFENTDHLPLDEAAVIHTKRLMACRRHGRYRSEQLRRDLGLIGGQRRLFGPLINVQPFDMPPKFDGLDVSLHILGAGAVDDITFTFRGDAKTSLMMEVDSNPALYSEEDTKAHSARLIAYLEDALKAERLADVALASPYERQRYLFDANATSHSVEDVTLVELIERTMNTHPNAPAVIFEGQTLTYAELDRRSLALASQLVEKGAGPDRLVAVALPRSLELIVALFAILRSGAAYLPLDVSHPKDRLSRILSSAQPVVILGVENAADLFDYALLPPSRWRSDAQHTEWPVATTDNLAYVIYTSGSTGEPKGVMIEHRAIVNRLVWMRQHYRFGPADRILQKTPATFDVSVWEFFLPALCGATLVVAPPEAHRDPLSIARIIRDENITTLHFVPSMLSAFMAEPSVEGLEVARVFCSGEELTAEQRDRFHRLIKGELHNLYGPTEAAVDVSYWEASASDTSSPLPIGWPVWNTRLYVLDDHLQPLPPGVAGHLYLGGVQLARGYLGRDDLTSDRFLPDPFIEGQRIYKTGDMAKLRADGAVVYLGRSDHQVKIRGLRIELGEIEAAIMTSGLVREAVVIAREDRPGDKRIVAYVVADPSLAIEALRESLSAKLPDYMIPAAFVRLDALPVTSNGKLDRRALPAPVIDISAGRRASSPLEQLLAILFKEILELDGDPTAESDFFSLGGDSLSAVQLCLRIRTETGTDPGLGAIFEHPAICDLAKVLEKAGSDEGLGPIIRLVRGDETLAPVFLIHPAGGIAWGYRHLAQQLGRRPVYGIQSPRLSKEAASPESLASLAASYAELIRQNHTGIYHLAGWSVGGILAQAVAVELQQQGFDVGLVALLDSYPCDCWRAEPEPDETAALRALLAIAGHDPLEHPELITKDAIIAFLKQDGSSLGGLPDAALDGVIRSVLDTNRLVRGHYHKRFDGTLTHFRAALDHKDKNLTPALWAAYCAEVETVDVACLHPQMTSAGAVQTIAPEILSSLTLLEKKGTA
ncbi:amino acid adenylation domain-containing protein [Rhizobium rhizoryzae]|uniref:Enterobactin synthetase component F n=1 Tax=Rhizobium rhizoryzae TaxID=451876 RepID=A0A7W6PNP3_9HYPH|nr:amino acid adenylation domain-containing protein [Rhizobium rhizoryzae]MBB4142135.1 enterobactin synthetase component F [Rhizobium rhizoryzae]